MSFIRSLSMDDWTAKQLEYMRSGGNDRFNQFLHNYNLEEDAPEVKYRSKAADFYRRRVLRPLMSTQLRSTAECLVFTLDPPAYDEGREEVEGLPKPAPQVEAEEYYVLTKAGN